MANCNLKSDVYDCISVHPLISRQLLRVYTDICIISLRKPFDQSPLNTSMFCTVRHIISASLTHISAISFIMAITSRGLSSKWYSTCLFPIQRSFRIISSSILLSFIVEISLIALEFLYPIKSINGSGKFNCNNSNYLFSIKF